MSLNTSYLAGATGKIVKVRAVIISTGLPYTAGAYNTAGLVVHATRDGSAQATITQVTAVSGTYTSSGFVHCGDGVYEIGARTADLAAGADGCVFSCSGITDVLFSSTRVDLLGFDPRSTTPPDTNPVTINGTDPATLIKAQVVAALITDTYAEPSSVPAATSSLKDKISYVFTRMRNKVTQTATTQLVRNDGDSGTVATSTVSDNGTTFTKGKDT